MAPAFPVIPPGGVGCTAEGSGVGEGVVAIDVEDDVEEADTTEEEEEVGEVSSFTTSGAVYGAVGREGAAT